MCLPVTGPDRTVCFLLLVPGPVCLPVTGPNWCVVACVWTGRLLSLLYSCPYCLFLLLTPATSFCPSLLSFTPALCVALLASLSSLWLFASTPCFCFGSLLPLLAPYSLCYLLCSCLPETQSGLSCRTCLLLLLLLSLPTAVPANIFGCWLQPASDFFILCSLEILFSATWRNSSSSVRARFDREGTPTFWVLFVPATIDSGVWNFRKVVGIHFRPLTTQGIGCISIGWGCTIMHARMNDA